MTSKADKQLKVTNNISTICIILGVISFIGNLIKLIPPFMLILTVATIILAIINFIIISKLPKKKPTNSPRNKTIVGLVFAILSVLFTIYILYALTYL